MQKRSRRGIRTFTAIQWSPTRSRYMVSYKTKVDHFVQVYKGAK